MAKINFPNQAPNINISGIKKTLRFSFFIFIVIVLIIFDGFYIVPAGYTGVIFDYGRGILENETGEGINLKIPLWQKATIFDIRTQEYTMSIASGEGYKYDNDAIESRSKDGQVVFVDATVLYRIDRKDASKILGTLGREQEVVRKVIRPKAREVIREVVGKYNALDLVSEKRSVVSNEINEDLTKSFSNDFITLEELVIRNVTFSEEFAAVIEQKEIARQNILMAQYEKNEAEERKAKKIIEAEAEAESIKLKGDALRANPEVIQLEFVNKMAADINWGILPDGVVPLLNL